MVTNNVKYSTEELRNKALHKIKSLEMESSTLSEIDVRKLAQELQIYKVELEIQNEELRKSQIETENSFEQFYQLFNNAPVGYLVLDDLAIIKLVNNYFCNLSGYSRNELISKPFSNLFLDDEKKIFLSRYKALFNKPENKSIELIIRKKDGNKFFAKLDGSKMPIGINKNIKERGTQFLLTVSDITSQKKSEAELISSKNEISEILESISDAFFSLDDQMKITYFNNAAENLLNLKREEVVGKYFLDAFPEAKGSIFDINYSKALKEKTYLSFETFFDVDPYKAWYSVSVYPSQKGISVFFQVITERKELEEKLRFDSLLLSEIGDAVISTDINNKIVFWNKAAEKLYGWMVDEVINKNIHEIIKTNLDQNEYLTDLNNIQSGIETSGESLFYKKDGTQFCAFVASSPVYNKDGQLIGRIDISRDISDRKRSEELIRLNHSRLECLLRISQHNFINTNEFLDYVLDETIKITSSKIGYIYFYDEDKQEFTLNTWSKNVMKECEVLNPQTIYKLEHTGIWGEAVRQRKEIIVNNFSDNNPLQKGYPKGHVKLNRFLTIPIFDAEKIVAVVGVANKQSNYDESDIIQLKIISDFAWKILSKNKMHEELSLSQQRLSLHFKQTPLGVIEFDLNGNVINWNSGAEKIFGYSYEEAKGKSLSLLVPLKIRYVIDEVWQSILQNKGGFRSTNQNLTKDNKEIYCEWFNTPLVDSSNKVIGVASLVMDVTSELIAKQELENYKTNLEYLVSIRTEELDRMNEDLILEIEKKNSAEIQLKESLEKEMELSKLKSRFISTASHEFRTPLASILSSIELVQRYGHKWDDVKKNEHIERIKSSVGYLTKLMDDVINVNKANVGKIQFAPSLINLKSLINSVIEEHSLSNKNHTFTFTFSPVSEEFVLDNKQLSIILSNLISNAIKYSFDGGNIEIDVSIKNNNIVISISDNGIGIPQNDIPLIFDSFHRASNVKEIRGTGLGLHIVKHAVDLHGGTISVDSKEGVGTTFIVTIPIKV